METGMPENPSPRSLAQSLKWFIWIGAALGAVAITLAFLVFTQIYGGAGGAPPPSPSGAPPPSEAPYHPAAPPAFAANVMAALPVALAGAIAGAVVGGFTGLLKMLGGLVISRFQRKRKKYKK
jgi:hypothetical protein